MPKARPPTSSPMMAGESNPPLPKESAEKRATTAGKNRARPAQSKGTRSWRWRLRGMKSSPATMPSRPKGTLTRKISRQPPAASKNPPTDGPRARPIAWAAPWMPMALPSDRLGTAR